MLLEPNLIRNAYFVDFFIRKKKHISDPFPANLFCLGVRLSFCFMHMSVTVADWIWIGIIHKESRT